MEFHADFLYRQDANFRREEGVRPAQDRIRVHRANRFDICHLAVRVNAGIGSAGTGDVHIMIEKLLKNLLELPLNRPKARLNLPAMELRAVVCESQLEVPHSIGYSMCLGVRAMPGVTATIITLNEEERIAEAIASLSCCDEVIVVDAGSTDRTRDIARARGARVVEQPWQGYSKQKNFAADQASNEWIFSIDADERVSAELAAEIVQWKQSFEAGAQQEKAWSVPRRVFYLGQWINHSGWYPDRKVRLYDRRHCRWEGDFVHEWVNVNGVTGKLRGDLLHFPYRDWNDQAARIERYTALAAQAARSSGRKGNILKLALAPPLSFIKAFFFRAGFLDGWRGLAIAYMGAVYVFKREFRMLLTNAKM